MRSGCVVVYGTSIRTMDRLNKTEEPARLVVGFHVEGAQNVAASPSDSEPHRGMQNSSSVPYLPPAMSVCISSMRCILEFASNLEHLIRFTYLALFAPAAGAAPA